MRSQCRMSRELNGLEAVAYEWLNTCTIRTSVLRFVKILYYRYCGVMTILTFGFHPRSSIQNIKFTPWRRDTKTRSSFLSGMTFLRAHDSHFKILSLFLSLLRLISNDTRSKFPQKREIVWFLFPSFLSFKPNPDSLSCANRLRLRRLTQSSSPSSPSLSSSSLFHFFYNLE